MKIFDSHAHIDALIDIDACICEAQNEGVVGIISPGLNLVTSEKGLSLSKKYPHFIYPALGYYPWEIDEENNNAILNEIDKQLPNYYALGEIGLDYKSKVNKTLQKETLIKLLEIAKKHNKPVILHVRYVHSSAFKIVKEIGVNNVVFHCFSGELDVLSKIIDEGYYVSATPSVHYNDYHRKAIMNTPLNNLLLETDAPVPYRDFISRPVHIIETLKGVSELKKIDIEDVAHYTFTNTIKFLKLE